MANLKKLRTWALGAFGAAINAGIGGISVVVVDPTDFNPFELSGLWKLLRVCFVLGIVGFGLYVKQHPVPVDEMLEEERLP